MKANEFAQMVMDGIHPVVTCLKDVEDAECYLESGMRCKITGCQIKHDDVYVFTFDLTDFDDFNRAFETNNYYDKNGQACLTAREAGKYKLVDTIYLGEDLPFEVESSERLKVYAAYKADGAGKSYVQWLEDQLSGKFA